MFFERVWFGRMPVVTVNNGSVGDRRPLSTGVEKIVGNPASLLLCRSGIRTLRREHPIGWSSFQPRFLLRCYRLWIIVMGITRLSTALFIPGGFPVVKAARVERFAQRVL